MDQPQSSYEDRQVRRQEQSSQARSKARNRKIMVWGGTLVVVAGIIALMVKASNNVQVPVSSGTLAAPVTAADISKGPAAAPITLVEYGDFQCPACGAFEPILKQLQTEPALKDKIRLVYRYYPLVTIHQHAQLAAQAAQAAQLQGKFWEMHDKLYDSQAQWENMSDTGARALYTTFASQIGVDMNKWKTDLDSQAVKDRIKIDVQSGDAAGITGTPTFFANGSQLQPPASYDQFKQEVAASLTASPAPANGTASPTATPTASPRP